MNDYIYVDDVACEGYVDTTRHTVWVGEHQQVPGTESWSAYVDRWFPPGEHVTVRTEQGTGVACVATSRMGTTEEWSKLAGIEPWKSAPR